MPSRRSLTVVAARMHEAGSQAFAEAERDWLGDAPAPFFEALERFGEALQAAGTGTRGDVEIERKYLLRRLPPEMPAGEVDEVAQGYIPGERLVERLRRRTRGDCITYLRTVKLGSGVARTEIEEETTAAVFDAMWPLTSGRRVEKRRHTVPDGDLAWEIDEFTDRELVLAELELPDEEHPVQFPEWLSPYVVREVTQEPEFLNLNLAK